MQAHIQHHTNAQDIQITVPSRGHTKNPLITNHYLAEIITSHIYARQKGKKTPDISCEAS